jgi:hypothetical protein
MQYSSFGILLPVRTMIHLFDNPRGRIVLGLCIIAWASVQFVLISQQGLPLASRIGLGLQVGVAAALIYSGTRARRRRL